MELTRFSQAPAYQAPKHHDIRSLRLQGFDQSAAKFSWVGISQILPGGGADMDASPLEKIYVVLQGEVTVEIEHGETQVLGALDSCYIPGGEARAIRNDSNHVATMLVTMPYPDSPS